MPNPDDPSSYGSGDPGFDAGYNEGYDAAIIDVATYMVTLLADGERNLHPYAVQCSLVEILQDPAKNGPKVLNARPIKLTPTPEGKDTSPDERPTAPLVSTPDPGGSGSGSDRIQQPPGANHPGGDLEGGQ